jgi:hypothetical protein
MLDKLTVSDFAGHINGAFRVVPGPDAPPMPEAGLELELIEARPLPARGAGAGRLEPFSLVFRGPREAPLPQRIHRLEREALGTLDIFLVPIGSEGDPDGTHYQAIFG